MKPMQDQETCMSSEEVVCAHVSSSIGKKKQPIYNCHQGQHACVHAETACLE